MILELKIRGNPLFHSPIVDMFNLTMKLKYYGVRFCPSSSAPKSFLLQLNRLTSSSSANALNSNSENSSNKDSSVEVHAKSGYAFSNKWSSRCLNKCPSEKPDSVIAFLKEHHFSDSRISVIVRKWPMVFQYVTETSFLPKFEFFNHLGFSNSDIVKIVTLAPNLLGSSLEDQIMPCVDFLKSFLSLDSVLRYSILRCPSILEVNLQDILLPNVGFLRELGVPESHIAEILKISPFTLCADPKSFRAVVKEVENFDLDPCNKNFITGIIVMSEVNISLWKEKTILYESWGWSEKQLRDAIRNNPRIMAASKDKITKIHDHLINKMGFHLSLLVAMPDIFLFSFQETIAPRCACYQALKSKGLIKKNCSIIHLLTCPNRLFFHIYIKHNARKDPEIFSLYNELFPKSKA